MRTADEPPNRRAVPGRRAAQPMRPRTTSPGCQRDRHPHCRGATSAIRQHVWRRQRPSWPTALRYIREPSQAGAQAGGPSALCPPATTSGRQQAKETHDRPVDSLRAPRRVGTKASTRFEAHGGSSPTDWLERDDFLLTSSNTANRDLGHRLGSRHTALNDETP